jgi:hypothetical protein
MNPSQDAQRRLIGEILVEMGYTDLRSINEARRAQMVHPERRLGELLVEMGYIKPEQLSVALARQTQNQSPSQNVR